MVSTPSMRREALTATQVDDRKRGPLVRQTLYAPVQGNARAKKWEWVGRGVWGGDFWDSIGNVIEENM